VTIDKDDPNLTAYALGELDDALRPAVEEQVKASADLRKEVDAIRQTAAMMSRELQDEPAPDAPASTFSQSDLGDRRRAVSKTAPDSKAARPRRRRWRLASRVAVIPTAALVLLCIGLVLSSERKFGGPLGGGAPEVQATTPRLWVSHDVPQTEISSGVSDRSGGAEHAGELGSGFSRSAYAGPPTATAPQLRLIYDARMSVAVEKELADAFPAKLGEKARSCGGYVSQSDSWRESGRQPTGRIAVRVPAARLNEVMDWIRGGATVLTSRMSVQDITEQYVDLEARLTNLLAGEARLKDLLARETGKLEEVLKVENAMRQVRQEIEQIQGKKRLWDSQIEFSTLTVEYRLASIYVAVAPPARTFGQRALLALSDSWQAFTDAMAAIVIGSIYVLPWAPVPLVLLVGGYLWCRRAIRNGKAAE